MALLAGVKALRVVKDPSGLKWLLRLLTNSFRLLGARGAVLFLYQRFGFVFLRRGGHFTLTPRNAAHPLECRSRTSDAQVFSGVFLEGSYSCIDELADVELIIDCGANAGYSTAYFLSRCPDAEVIAVEPDEGNAAMLRRNTLPYGDRVRTLRSAVWSHRALLVVGRETYRDGREWTRQVREARPGEPDTFEAVDIGTLLRESTHERISVLKIDIEGSEGVVFSAGYESWLEKVDTILIELHDDSGFGNCSSIFHRAIADQGFTVTRFGELTVCEREQNPR